MGSAGPAGPAKETDPDAATLVARARAGDTGAWSALTDRYTRLLWSVARGMRLNHADAGDAVQTTWLRLVERLDGIRQPEHVSAWLMTTVRRECLALLRRNAREYPGLVRREEDLVDPGDAPGELLLREERDADLWCAFATLRPACQSLLRMLTADPPLSYADASRVLDMPMGSVGPIRKRCLESLRKALTGDVPRGRTSRPPASA